MHSFNPSPVNGHQSLFGRVVEFKSRDRLAKAKEKPEEVKEIDVGNFRARFDQESKELSQLIARSWLNDDPVGQEVREILLDGQESKIKAMLHKYGVDLEASLGPIEIVVNWDSYYLQTIQLDRPKRGPDGQIELDDTGREIRESYVRFYLPYPPRPPEDNVTQEQLKAWIANTNEAETSPPYPYIPMTGGC